MSTTYKAKKLIEVAMPIKEISAESQRDKSIRHGHISTLHLWWARRPLPTCRAVVFASLIPDPLDPHCSPQFKEAVEILLGKANNPGDPYAPYKDIPWTSVHDPMEDNLRNRLQMFIGKFTEPMQNYLLGKGMKPESNNTITNFSLIKWEAKNDETVINKARKLIWVAYNAEKNEAWQTKSAKELLELFDAYYMATKKAEEQLYSLVNRHQKTEQTTELEHALEEAKNTFLNHMPKVFDPFAGGGAIPLEIARLGCRSYGNDINPVAHIIQKSSAEFPQKFGKPIVYTKEEFIAIYGVEAFKDLPAEYTTFHQEEVHIPNRLSYDVEFYAKTLLNNTNRIIGHLYPKDENGNEAIAYFWSRTGNCSNPSCNMEVPLFKRFILSNTTNKKVSLYHKLEGQKLKFSIDDSINKDKFFDKSLKCPSCGSITSAADLKAQYNQKKPNEILVAKVINTPNGKEYKIVNDKDLDAIKSINDELLENHLNEKMIKTSDLVSGRGWGIETWGELFNKRQALFLDTFIKEFHKILESKEDEYFKIIKTYLSLFINRVLQRQTSFGIWDITRENLQAIYGRQAISMMFEYPESNPFSGFGGGALNQIDWIVRYIESESKNSISAVFNHSSSGDKNQFENKELSAVITDPPYYDAIAYADLSDFFYVIMKRTLGELYPLNFATPITPKSEECTALKHHHDGKMEKAKVHFEKKLTQIFDAIEEQTEDIVSIMFAHQTTEAWTTLCNSILDAKMNITGSWALDTEYSFTGIKQNKAFLSSSVTVSCVPSVSDGYGSYKQVKKDIERTVKEEVDNLYQLGFRGADLLTACFGKAVSQFGQYKAVEKADGSNVTVAELLEMTREAAFNSLLQGFDGDDTTKFYIAWLQLNGFVETSFDDAAKFVRVGLAIDIQDLFNDHILISSGNKQTLANFTERNELKKNLGDLKSSHLIDRAHKAMHLYKGTNRIQLLEFIAAYAQDNDALVWRVLTSLDELLPKDCEDQKMTRGLLTDKESLIRDSHNIHRAIAEQGKLEL